MFFIQDVMIAEELKDARFACQLKDCKGGCCIEGDGGAPLEPEEKKWIHDNLETLIPLLSDASVCRIEDVGPTYVEEGEHHVAVLPHNGACVFLLEEKDGYRQCLFEKLYTKGEIDFQKPISCHLFPLLFRKTKYHKLLSFQRRNICLSAWGRGEHILKTLGPALKRKFGDDFVRELFENIEIDPF